MPTWPQSWANSGEQKYSEIGSVAAVVWNGFDSDALRVDAQLKKVMSCLSRNWIFPRFERVLNRGGPYDPANSSDRFLWPVCCRISQNRARTEGVNSIPPACEVRALRRRCLDSFKNPGNVKRVVAKARDGIRVFVIPIPAMLASGGYPWTVIRVEDRDVYLVALESASSDRDIGPFARFVADWVAWSLGQAA